MEYQNVHFRIQAGYKWGEGMDKDKADAFYSEIKTLFEGANWIVKHQGGHGVCPTVQNGLSYLYCHPMDISGVVEKTIIDSVESVLKSGKTFRHYGTDVYDTIIDMSDAAYSEHLNRHLIDIRSDIIEAFKTKRSNLYISEYNIGSVLSKVCGKWQIYRIQNGDKWRDKDGIVHRIVSDLFSELVDIGLIVSGNLKKGGKGYRATKKVA